MKKILIMFLLCLVTLFSFTGCKENENIVDKENKIRVVATNFPCYDFTRAIFKGNDNVEIKMLLKPGVESHSYDPTPQDILAIEKSDVFVYVGGESDVWVTKILESINNKDMLILKMSDYVEMRVEETKEGMQCEEEDDDDDEIEYDEHVWTSPLNAIKIIEAFEKEIEKIDEENRELYIANASEYIEEIRKLDNDFRNVVMNGNKKEIIFADRFPIIYFTKEYGLDYYAAFPGCSSEAEVSPRTLSFLMKKIKDDNINAVFHLELSSEKVASVIKDTLGVESLLFHTAHNVSREELENGETYVSLMRGNVERLELALR